ncbi:MAG TPA: response regulator [Pyrinomonadaceae bacterium]|jgi:CheY-like chemotaxis protein
MHLAKEIFHQIANPTLTQNERARLRCQLSKALEESGNYEAARDAMGELWQRVGDYPVLEGLDETTAAEVLLQVGELTGYIGSAKQIEGAQNVAKDLISKSASIFKQLQQIEKVAEAETNLAICYARQGAFDEARIILREALSRLTDKDGDLKALALLRSAAVEKIAKRLNDALSLLNKAAPLIEASDDHTLKGRFHNEFATILENLKPDDYIDRAFIEYTAASYHFEQAGHTRYHAYVENNIGFLLFTLGKFTEAHEHLDRAQALFTSLKDSVHSAQVDETRARILMAEGRVSDAEKLVRSVVQILEKSEEQSLFAEALTTHGTALARLGRYQQGQLTLQHAVEVAEQAGDLEGAGQAALVLIEELGERLNEDDLKATYERAADLLEKSQHPGILGRLHACARKTLHLLVERPAPKDWKGFSLKDEVHRYERRFIERALEDAKRSVTRAAHMLGLKHQTLIALLNNRHSDLLSARKPVTRRRRSIIRKPVQRLNWMREKSAAPVNILHVEDDRLASDAVRDALKMQGWSVELCADGETALGKLESDAPYDVLLFDYDLPGMSGVELVRRARRLAHRRKTPVIMLSSVNCPREARGAGADAFLRKPEDVLKLAETISRLLADNLKRR